MRPKPIKLLFRSLWLLGVIYAALVVATLTNFWVGVVFLIAIVKLDHDLTKEGHYGLRRH